MHSTFVVYQRLGFGHIADLGATDHILFIVALAAGYGLAHWRHLLVLVTAFTVGHSITLALATLRLVAVSGTLVEVLIPLTILATAVFNLAETRTPAEHPGLPGRQQRVKYAMALVFGLVHGLGFSTFLRAMLGDEEGIALPLFAFNVGLEVGQIAILVAVLVVGAAVVRRSAVTGTWWTRIVSAVAAAAAVVMVVERLPS